jgi:ribosomal protein L22
MTPSKPGDPSQGKPAEKEKTEVEAAEAKQAAAASKQAPAPEVEVEATAEEAKPKPRRTRAKKAKADADEAVAEPVAEADDAASEPVAEAAAAEADEPAAEEAVAEADEPVAEPAKPRRRRSRAAAEEPAEAEPAPTRTRTRLEPGQRVVVRAQAKYVRTSARKARLVCDHIRGKSVQEARAILAHTPRAVSRDWSKLLESAVANAEHNHELLGDDLRIAQVTADEGPTLKRFRPRAMGRATRIRKRTSHLTILLTPKES